MIPEQKEISNEIISIPRRFSISYKIIGILFVIITIHMLIVLLSAPLGIRSLSYIFYIIFVAALAYGFFTMKKWIITLLGIIVLFTAIKIGVGFFQGAFKANALGISALIPFIIFGALFVFSYFSRFHLKGGYEKIK